MYKNKKNLIINQQTKSNRLVISKLIFVLYVKQKKKMLLAVHMLIKIFDFCNFGLKLWMTIR